MATEWAKMSVSELKAELTSKGLDASGKKADMVTRLTEFEEEAIKNVTSGEENDQKKDIAMEETADNTAAVDNSIVNEEPNSAAAEDTNVVKDEPKSGEDTKEKDKDDRAMETDEKEKEKEKAEKRAKWWVHFIGGKKIDKYKNLHCVQAMGDAKRRKDMLALSKEFRVRAYPFSIVELNDPTIKEIMLKCANFSVNFHPVTNEEGEKGIVGLLVLNLAKKADVEDVMETLKTFKDDINVHHSANENVFEEFNSGWKKCHTGAIKSEDALILIPKVADGIKEEHLWQWFPTALEIYLLGAKKAPVYVSGQHEVRDQSPYAYVQFANFDAAKVAVAALNEKGPDREDVKQMNLISFTRIVEYMKDKIPKAKGKLEKSIFSAEPVAAKAKSARQTNKSPAQGQRDKKTFGVPSTRRQTRPGFQQNRPRGGMPPRSRPVPPLMRDTRPPMQMGQVRQPQNMYGPSQEEQGMQMLGELISSLGGVQNTADVVSNLFNQEGGSGYEQRSQGFEGMRQQGAGSQARGRWRNQQGMRRSPKRKLSPSIDQNESKRRRSAGYERADSYNQRGNQGYGMVGGGGYESYEREYSAPGAFGGQQDNYGQQQGFRGGRGVGLQGQGGAKSLGSMDVVSRIVRASKELKEAMGTKRTDYGQGSYGGDSSGFQGYGTSDAYGFDSNPYGGSGYR